MVAHEHDGVAMNVWVVEGVAHDEFSLPSSYACAESV